MKKYGLFDSNQQFPLQEYHGDYMRQSGEYVSIFKNAADSGNSDELLHAIRLDKGHSVKTMEG